MVKHFLSLVFAGLAAFMTSGCVIAVGFSIGSSVAENCEVTEQNTLECE